MTTNARIRNLAPGVDAEMIAVQTHIFYNPQTGAVDVSFQAAESLVVNGEVGPSLGAFDILHTSIADIATRTAAAGLDPVTGADLSKFSAAGVMVVMKAFYDTLFAERAEARAATVATTAAEPAPQ